MQLIFNFREGLEARSCKIFDNFREPSEAQLKETDACIINFYEGVRQPWGTWRLKTKLKRHAIPSTRIIKTNSGNWRKSLFQIRENANSKNFLKY